MRFKNAGRRAAGQGRGMPAWIGETGPGRMIAGAVGCERVALTVSGLSFRRIKTAGGGCESRGFVRSLFPTLLRS